MERLDNLCQALRLLKNKIQQLLITLKGAKLLQFTSLCKYRIFSWLLILMNEGIFLSGSLL